MSLLRKKTVVDNSFEDIIVTGMIVDTGFLRETFKATKPEYFKSDQAKILVTWIREYYEENDRESPGEEVKEIYEFNKNKLDEDEAITMRLFLNKVSKEYEGREFNAKYVANRTYEYLERNAYEYITNQIQKFLKRGNLAEAKAMFEGANKSVFQSMSRWRSFSDPDLLESWWWKKKETMLTFAGDLGRYMPRIERSRLYAMLGPAKRSKSFWLMEWAVMGVIDRMNVLFFSLEMSEAELHERWLKRISGMEIMEDSEKMMYFPVIDCLNNQTGECEREDCTSIDSIVANEKGIPDRFEEHPDHIPCTVCRENDGPFIPTTWMVEEEFYRLSFSEAKLKQEQFEDFSGGDRIKFMTFPISSASVDDLENSIRELEEREGFIPDMVVIDYADILKKDSKIKEDRHKHSEIWKELSRMAKVRDCIVVTASQGNRGSMSKDEMDLMDVADDISKVMTIDGIFAINEEGQNFSSVTQKDKYWCRQRIETLALRYSKFTPGRKCVTLNNFETGQVCLDSYITF